MNNEQHIKDLRSCIDRLLYVNTHSDCMEYDCMVIRLSERVISGHPFEPEDRELLDMFYGLYEARMKENKLDKERQFRVI